MSVSFEELDFRPTPMGVLSLRRRRRPIVRYRRLRNQARRRIPDVEPVHRGRDRTGAARTGGARRARISTSSSAASGSATPRGPCSKMPRVRSLIVVDALAEVIEWHEQGLLPLGKELTGDPRCRLVHGDFFAMSHSAEGFDTAAPRRRFDAVLVDIDHSPRKLLHPRHAALYEPEGLRGSPAICVPAAFSRCGRTIRRMKRSSACSPSVFATSDGACRDLRQSAYGDHEASNTVYVAVKADLPDPEATIEAGCNQLIAREAACGAAVNLPMPIGHAMLNALTKQRAPGRQARRIQGFKSPAPGGTFRRSSK